MAASFRRRRGKDGQELERRVDEGYGLLLPLRDVELVVDGNTNPDNRLKQQSDGASCFQVWFEGNGVTRGRVYSW